MAMRMAELIASHHRASVGSGGFSLGFDVLFVYHQVFDGGKLSRFYQTS